MTGPISFNPALVTYDPETCTIRVTPPIMAHPMTMAQPQTMPPALPPTTTQTAPQGKTAIPRQGTNGQPSYRSPERPHKSYNSACEVCRDRKAKCPGEKPDCSFCISNGYECVYPTSKREKDRIWTEHLEQRTQQDEAVLEIIAAREGISVEELRERTLGDAYDLANLTLLQMHISPQPEPKVPKKPKKSNKRKRSETDESTDSSNNETVTGNTVSAEQAGPVAPAAPSAPTRVSAPVVVPQPDSTLMAPPLVTANPMQQQQYVEPYNLTLNQDPPMDGPAFASGFETGSGSGSALGPDSAPAIDSGVDAVSLLSQYLNEPNVNPAGEMYDWLVGGPQNQPDMELFREFVNV
ncbi:Zn(II)2Cys6 transcription factor domain-containing protein [Aspergillus stella-maris]|uniref:Zn(II)2Cys6 transcription factor domain-containing protein n=1 Tax=Aspergillus stella-maris TaxID=1810926 RepID=UPI003CCCD56F